MSVSVSWQRRLFAFILCCMHLNEVSCADALVLFRSFPTGTPSCVRTLSNSLNKKKKKKKAIHRSFFFLFCYLFLPLLIGHLQAFEPTRLCPPLDLASGPGGRDEGKEESCPHSSSLLPSNCAFFLFLSLSLLPPSLLLLLPSSPSSFPSLLHTASTHTASSAPSWRLSKVHALIPLVQPPSLATYAPKAYLSLFLALSTPSQERPNASTHLHLLSLTIAITAPCYLPCCTTVVHGSREPFLLILHPSQHHYTCRTTTWDKVGEVTHSLFALPHGQRSIANSIIAHYLV